MGGQHNFIIYAAFHRESDARQLTLVNVIIKHHIDSQNVTGSAKINHLVAQKSPSFFKYILP